MRVACVTTLNEAPTIGPLVDHLHRYVDRVVVADAASTDGTTAIAARAGANVLYLDRCPISTGTVEAVRTALLLGAQQIITIDAGGSHEPRRVPLILEFLDPAIVGTKPYDLVIGSRFVVGGKYTGRPLRATLSALLSFYMSSRTKIPLSVIGDWSSGYRGYSQRAATALVEGPVARCPPARARMHGWQLESLARLLHRIPLSRIMTIPIRYTAGRSSARLSTFVEVLVAARRAVAAIKAIR